MRLGDRDLVPHPAGRDRHAGQLADLGQLGAAGQHHDRRGDRPLAGLHSGDRLALGGQAGERDPLADLHAAGGQRHRVGGHVARRGQVAVVRAVRAAHGQARGHRRVQRVQLARLRPADVQAQLALHGHPLAGIRDIRRGEARDRVALRGEARVDPELGGLAQVEPPGPLAQQHGPLRAALGAHDARGAAAGALAEGPLLQQDDPAHAGLAQEVRAPRADRAAAHHHGVRGVATARLGGGPGPGSGGLVAG